MSGIAGEIEKQPGEGTPVAFQEEDSAAAEIPETVSVVEAGEPEKSSEAGLEDPMAEEEAGETEESGKDGREQAEDEEKSASGLPQAIPAAAAATITPPQAIQAIPGLHTTPDPGQVERGTGLWSPAAQIVSPTLPGDEKLLWPKSIQLGSPVKRKTNVSSHWEYQLTSEPHHVEHVFRRYRHFEWLSKMLVIRFPGMFVPPLPPKSIRNSEPEFLQQRREGLQRFLVRVTQNPYFVRSEAYQEFFSRAQTFDHVQKEIGKEYTQEPWEEFQKRYEDYFPDLWRISDHIVQDDAEVKILALLEVLKQSQQQLQQMLKGLSDAAKHAKGFHTGLFAFAEAFQQFHTTEKGYPERPGKLRANVSDILDSWQLQHSMFQPNFERLLLSTVRDELEDCKSLIHVALKVRDQAARRNKALAKLQATELKAQNAFPGEDLNSLISQHVPNPSDPKPSMQDLQGSGVPAPMSPNALRLLRQLRDDREAQAREDLCFSLQSRVLLAVQLPQVWSEKVFNFETHWGQFAVENSSNHLRLVEIMRQFSETLASDEDSANATTTTGSSSAEPDETS